MAIPKATFYHDDALGAGSLATLENATVNTLTVAKPIKFGQAVAVENGEAVPATKAPIYGIALKRVYTTAENWNYDEIQNDAWRVGEAVGVVRDGTIAVPVSEDVDEQDPATIDANGFFKKAGDGDVVVGTFLTKGDKDKTASLQTRIQFSSGK